MANSESSTRLKYSEGIDRISSLPEPLHSRILSLLPTKTAVATSILARRWKFLWTSITNLSFDDECIYNLRLRSGEALITRRQKFTQFVNSVLVLLNPPFIQNFHLRGNHEHCDPFYLQLWICAAIRRTIQMLELYLVLAKPMDLPLSHFNCKTLTVLKISGGDIHLNVVASASICFPNLLTLDLFGIRFTISSNGSVSFPSLKDLILGYVKYANEESVHKLFASCPVLDRLNIKRNLCDNVLCLVISIPSLQRLYLDCSGKYHASLEYKLQIDTPALQILRLIDNSFCEYFTLENLSCLVNAMVKFRFDHLSDIQLDHIIKKEKNISKFIGGLFNANNLFIAGPILKGIGSLSENIAPIFRNLTRLIISRFIFHDWSFLITNLLERTDNLESLSLMSERTCWGSHESWCMEPSSVPMCSLRRVTKIEFTLFGDCSSELEMVRYFLKNAEALELLTIYDYGRGSLEKRTPRGSRACQVEFS